MEEGIRQKARAVRLLVMDCDGVLTDGRLYFSAAGEAMKVFHVRDGQGIVNWRKAGYTSGIISGRDAGEIVRSRAREIGIDHVRVGSADKVRDFGDISEATGVRASETAYIGDDVGDLPLLKLVGFPIAVADAVPEVLAAAVYVTQLKGGSGAVREVVDLILSAKSST